MQCQIPARHNCERTQMVSCIRAASGDGCRCSRPASIRARARMETAGLASGGIAPSLDSRGESDLNQEQITERSSWIDPRDEVAEMFAPEAV